MPTTAVHLAAILLVTVTFGCAGTQRDEALQDVRRRASFDFNCPEGDIQLTVLDSYRDMGERYNQIGAQGCDHRGAYVLGSGGWVLNSDAEQAELPAPPSVPEQAPSPPSQ